LLESIPIRFRLAIGGVILVALSLLAVERQVSASLTEELDRERMQVQSVTALYETARSAHIQMLERWLSPVSEQAARENVILERMNRVRSLAVAFADVPPLTPEEPAIRGKLLASVAAWSNRVQQALVSADGPEYRRELDQYLNAIERDAGNTLRLAATAGERTRTNAGRLARLQTLIHLAILASVTVLAGLALWTFREQSRLGASLREAESARRRQEETTRMRSQFFANMSHELRTPLVTIRGVATVLGERTGDVEVQEAGLRIEREAHELLGSINNILDLAKLETGNVHLALENVSLSEVLTRCARRCEGLIGGKPVRLAITVAPTLPLVRGDFVKLQQIFTNLFANAIKFTQQGEVNVTARSEADGIVVEVADSGVGIRAEALERIWRPFEQADGDTTRRFGGTGLGLSIVKSLVDLMGGQVTVQSQVGSGTTFRVRLPAGGSP
jgi:signal transduction histidine kinase